MALVGQGKRVIIAIDEADQWHHQQLAAALIERIRAEGGAGATVIRGMMGFGAHGRIHTTRLVELSSDLPLLIIWVDSDDAVARILPLIRPMVSEGLITVEPIEIVLYQHRDAT